MANNKKPAYILKNVSLAINGKNEIGQIEEMNIPMPEQTFNSKRNAGMIKPRSIPMGFEELEGEYTFSGIHPDAFELYGVLPGKDFPLIAYGYMQSEDGTEHDCRAEMVAKLASVDLGGWKPGDDSPVGSKIKVDELKFFIDDKEIFAIDDFDFSAGGKSTTPGMKDALRAN